MNYLGIPYRAGGTKCLLSILIDNSLYTELWIETSEDSEFIAYVPVPEGRLELKLSDESVRPLITVKEQDGNTLSSPYRFHFAPAYGWMNDPNGLHFDGKLYHMYFQYNPVSRAWGNLSWGHAVSSDLISWKQLDTALLPINANEQIYSGSAIKEGEVTAVYYTINDSSDPKLNTQRRREVDNDGALVNETIVIGPTVLGARDPKAFFHNGREYIVMYLENNDFALYRKEEDAWVRTDTFSADEAWECPDIIALSDRLIFTSADGFYWLIDITSEGKVSFLSERRELFINRKAYASQTFSGTTDRIIQVSWLRLSTPALHSCGVMGIPKEMSLDDKGVIHLSPVRELLALTTGTEERICSGISTESSSYILRIEGTDSFQGTINGTDVNYTKGKLKISDEEVDFSSDVIILFIDGPVLEVTDGEYVLNACFELGSPSGSTRLAFSNECKAGLTVI